MLASPPAQQRAQIASGAGATLAPDSPSILPADVEGRQRLDDYMRRMLQGAPPAEWLCLPAAPVDAPPCVAAACCEQTVGTACEAACAAGASSGACNGCCAVCAPPRQHVGGAALSAWPGGEPLPPVLGPHVDVDIEDGDGGGGCVVANACGGRGYVSAANTAIVAPTPFEALRRSALRMNRGSRRGGNGVLLLALFAVASVMGTTAVVAHRINAYAAEGRSSYEAAFASAVASAGVVGAAASSTRAEGDPYVPSRVEEDARASESSIRPPP